MWKAWLQVHAGEKHGSAYYLTVRYAKGCTRQVYGPNKLLPLAAEWVRNSHQAKAVLEEIPSVSLELIRLKEGATGT